MNPTAAPRPPMGWNSWDSYGTTVTEAEVLANAQFLAEHLLPLGAAMTLLRLPAWTSGDPQMVNKASMYWSITATSAAPESAPGS